MLTRASPSGIIILLKGKGEIPCQTIALLYRSFGIEVKPRDVGRLVLLHELGHAATWGDFGSAELFWEALCKDEEELDFTAYWRLPSEWAANEWAAAKGRELGWWG